MTTRRSLYKDYLLSCHVAKLECGGFKSQVAIISMVGDKTRSQRFVDLPEVFATDAEAADKATAAGMEWVDTNEHIIDRGFYVDRLLKRR
jgi:hypothetical protein